ncbi:MAG: hypothetical protein Q9181_006872 [Wetmoreana brouardii]
MAKESPETEEKRLKKEKKERKAEKKRSETNGVHKSNSSKSSDKPDKKDRDKSERKEKREKKEHRSERKRSEAETAVAAQPPTTDDGLPIKDAAAEDAATTTKLLDTLEEEKPGSLVVREEGGDLEIKVKTKPLLGALVPFANPLADEKGCRKVLKGVKKDLANKQTAAKHKTLKRGVKEVVKCLRKSTPTSTSTTSSSLPHAIVILAADISPMDSRGTGRRGEYEEAD